MFPADGETILQVDRVSKIYSRSRQTTQARLTRTLSRAIFGRRFDPMGGDLRSDEFYAVHDVSFALKRGEALGIIGLNGSGKTTLLRMLAGQLLPDDGSITVTGRTASMIDLTAGFQTSASGRDNIFLRGAALGRSREQMQADYDAIVDFAELGDAIEAPVATYSSGMMMRLAFSIVAAVAPDLLFIDEVLAVGDFRFRQKCLARVRDLRQHSAFVMVTHSMTDVVRFCERAIVMNRGEMIFIGQPEEAIKIYESIEAARPIASGPVRVIPDDVENSELISDFSAAWAGASGETLLCTSGSQARLHISFSLKYAPRRLVVGVPLYDQAGNVVTGFSTEIGGRDLNFSAGVHHLELTIPNLPLNPGTYRAAIGIVDGQEFVYMRMIGDIRITAREPLYWGLFTTQYSWKKKGDDS